MQALALITKNHSKKIVNMSRTTKILIDDTAKEIAEYITHNNIQNVDTIKTIVKLKLDAGIEQALQDAYKEVILRKDAATAANGKGNAKINKELAMYRNLIAEIQREDKYKRLTEYIRKRHPETLREFFETIDKEDGICRQ